jgi:autotransporter-associated beta strand protein
MAVVWSLVPATEKTTMEKTFLTACASLCACLLTLPIQADPYIWDNQNNNGIWNDPVNWGINGNPNNNVAPTAGDSAIFRSDSPAGTVTLTNDGFAQKIRQNVSAPARIITIGADETVDRTLTLSGTSTELFDCAAGTADLTLDGTPNGYHARLKLVINDTQTACPVNVSMSLVLNCNVSGTNGFALNAGGSGTGRLVLGGANTYSGPTTVNAGTLLVNGSLAAASAVSVAPRATLGGTGTIAGPVSVAASGTLSPGASVGTLTLNGGLALSGDLFIEVDKSLSPSNDAVAVTGILTNGGTGTLTVVNLGPALVVGDSFQIFNKPVLNGGALHVVSSGGVVWTNRLAVDGSIAVLPGTPPPVSGDPTNVFTWTGAALSDQNWGTAANWMGNVAPRPLSSNIVVFQGDIKVPYNWPYIDTNYGTTILIFSNNIVLNGIKILAGINHTMNLGSYVLQQQPPDAQSPCYFGIDSPIAITWSGGHSNWVINANFTNALGDASVGGQTEFQCIGGRLDVYGVLKDGLGAHSRLVKSGDKTLNLCGMHANTYTGGTVVNAGPIKMAKPAGLNAIPGDVTVNGTGALLMNNGGGEQIADTAIVTLNDSGLLDVSTGGGQPETVQTVQSASANASIVLASAGTLTVAPSSSVTYSNGGLGESDFSGSISDGGGTVVMNGTGIYGMLGVNSVANLTVNSGTLKVNGNSGTGPVQVNTGGTLLGQGTITGAVTVANGGTIGAGFSAGSLTLAAGLDLSASGNGPTNVWELAALKDSGTGVAGTDFDQIVLTGGTLALGAQATLDIRFIGSATAPNSSNPFWQSAHTWAIISLSGGSNPGPSNFGNVKNGSYAAGNLTTAADGSGGIVLTFTPAVAPPVTPPRITSITNTGTGTATVRYTNTLAGTNYTLVYNTNLNNTTNWYPTGTKTAVGTSDSQTDSSATNSQRYYRVFYP